MGRRPPAGGGIWGGEGGRGGHGRHFCSGRIFVVDDFCGRDFFLGTIFWLSIPPLPPPAPPAPPPTPDGPALGPPPLIFIFYFYFFLPACLLLTLGPDTYRERRNQFRSARPGGPAAVEHVTFLTADPSKKSGTRVSILAQIGALARCIVAK